MNAAPEQAAPEQIAEQLCACCPNDHGVALTRLRNQSWILLCKSCRVRHAALVLDEELV